MKRYDYRVRRIYLESPNSELTLQEWGNAGYRALHLKESKDDFDRAYLHAVFEKELPEDEED